jgi:hypothetical protein
LISGETKKQDGKIVPIRGEKVPYGGQETSDVITNFGRSKLAPIPGAVWNVLAGENVVGEETTPGAVARDLVVPMSWDSLTEAVKDRGVSEGVAVSILSLLGMGLQTYEKYQPKPKKKKGPKLVPLSDLAPSGAKE